MKRVVVMFLAVLVILCISGCGLIREPESGSDIKAEMLKYLEDKYDQEFEVEYISFGDWLHPQTEMAAYPVGGNSVTDQFVVTRDKEDRRVILEDGYYAILIREEYEEYIRDVIKKYFPNCKYYTNIMERTLKAELTKETTLEEALKIQPLPLGISIYDIAMNESEYETTFNDFCEELLNIVPNATVLLIGLKETDFENLSRENENDKIYDIVNNRYSRVNFYIRDRWRSSEVENE